MRVGDILGERDWRGLRKLFLSNLLPLSLILLTNAGFTSTTRPVMPLHPPEMELCLIVECGDWKSGEREGFEKEWRCVRASVWKIEIRRIRRGRRRVTGVIGIIRC